MKFEDRNVIEFKTQDTEDGAMRMVLRIEDDSYGDRGMVYSVKLAKEHRDVKWFKAALKAIIRRIDLQSERCDGEAISIPIGTEETITEVIV